MAKKIIHPNEKKIKKYQQESATFDDKAYRKVFYRTGAKLNGDDKKGLHPSGKGTIKSAG